MKVLKLLLDSLLAIIARCLFPLLELATFVVVAIKKGRDALVFFDRTGYRLDVISASRHRAFRNWAVVGKGGVQFVEGTDKTISYMIGLNRNREGLTPFGKALYIFLYIVDFTNRKNGGHCASAVAHFRSIETKQ